MSEIKLIRIKEILNMNFFIPDYQRGYRWEPQQALDLLNDIEEFSNKADRGDEEIYCIQPLVVKKRDEEELFNKIHDEAKSLSEVENLLKNRSWDVVDGQQRLTTIFIILSILNSKSFSIEYQTRDGSSDALKKLNSMSDEEKKSNIDYYHMKNVYDKASEWLGNHSGISDKFRDVLMNNVCFIWYEIPETDDAITVFTRLNIGKIPLTDAELIKALFLNNSHYKCSNNYLENKRSEIAMQWDEIEFSLQNDEFWLFIHGKEYSKPTRIDFIFDLICGKNAFGIGRKDKIGNDEHKTFRYFLEAFDEYSKADGWVCETAWKEVRKYYQIFNEWYHDYRLYHYVGFVIDQNILRIDNLTKEWDKHNKEEFVDYLRSKIKEKVFTEKGWTKETLKEYRFDEDKKQNDSSNKNKNKRECLSILLLHNVETIIQQNLERIEKAEYKLPDFTKFPFHLFKSEKWDVEHIRPASGDDFSHETDKNLFLKLSINYIDDKETIDWIDNYFSRNGEKGRKSFSDIFERIVNLNDTLTDSEKNRIWNFTLLDASTNREYQNAIFPIKRAFIANKENGYKTTYKEETYEIVPDKEGKREIAFIPPCTKNVFVKFYTSVPETLTSWTKKDAEAYYADILDKLDFYFM